MENDCADKQEIGQQLLGGARPPGALARHENESNPGIAQTHATLANELYFGSRMSRSGGSVSKDTTGHSPQNSKTQWERVPTVTPVTQDVNGQHTGHGSQQIWCEATDTCNPCDGRGGRRYSGGGPAPSTAPLMASRVQVHVRQCQHETRDIQPPQGSRTHLSTAHMDAAEGRWAECVRHGVAGALDEAMEALEVELSYREPNTDAFGNTVCAVEHVDTS